MCPGGQESSPKAENESLHLIAIPSTIHHVSAVPETQPGEHSMKEDQTAQSNCVVAITFG